MKINPPVIVDNTVISTFGGINRFDILEKLYAKNIIVPTNVLAETIKTSPLEALVQAAFAAGWLEEYTISYSGGGRGELAEYAKLNTRYGSGECAVMAIGKTWECTIASDDMRATRKYCKKYCIHQIGTLGILYHAYREGIISAGEAQQMLSDMISIVKYSSPVSNFQSVIDWFEKGVGRELF